jgi:hypothetical protein
MLRKMDKLSFFLMSFCVLLVVLFLCFFFLRPSYLPTSSQNFLLSTVFFSFSLVRGKEDTTNIFSLLIMNNLPGYNDACLLAAGALMRDAMWCTHHSQR